MSLLIPTPLRGLLGGITLSLPVFTLISLTGNSLGISGFIHGSVRGWRNSNSTWKHNVLGFGGLVAGGIVIGILENAKLSKAQLAANAVVLATSSWTRILLSGFLVGLGSRLQNGCTSGHMICGVSRLSPRSATLTAAFCAAAALVTHIVHRGSLPQVGSSDWTLGALGVPLLILQSVPFLIQAGLLWYGQEKSTVTHPKARLLTTFVTSVHFALALQLGGLTDPQKVVSFLVLPFPYPELFDSTLLFLAIGAIPTSVVLYQVGVKLCSAKEQSPDSPTEVSPLTAATEKSELRPLLGGSWSVPEHKFVVDRRLLLGAVIFGIGWGLEGICPGPALINLGRELSKFDLSAGSDLYKVFGWVAFSILGGFAALN